ncbi:sensor of ECF-type sigma factor [Ulvibacter antarcticus]|uniref:LTXXQ motif family protein n=1 Tax=Ulvibacter antarcticus TaxID=442714 RepID=A0A3L9YXU8_9FLAO|nr:sensor of ECF-type sigma factor [Ulvibacter antarcticus]RMA64660.1 hypothetical protein BXY75_1539 [Ulvibacter antarcticus]
MKNILITLLFISFGMHAQSDRHEKIKALKVAFITEELDLTPTEAEAFWPIYNVYSDEMHQLRKTEMNEVYKRLKDGIDTLSDAEANELIDKGHQIESDRLMLQKELSLKLRKAIPPKKIIKLRKAEEDFKRKLLEKYRNQKRRGQ